MNTTRISFQNIGIPTVFFFYFLFVYFLTVGQIADTSFLSRAISPLYQNTQHNTNPAVLGTQDDQYESRLLAQADTGAGEDGVHTVCATPGDGCEYVGGEGIQNAIDAAGDNQTVYIRNGSYSIATILISLKTGLTIKGEDRDNTKIIDNGFKILSGSEIDIQDLSLIGGNNLNYQTLGVEVLEDARNITISNILIEGHPHGISSLGSINIQDCTIRTSIYYGVGIFQTTGSVRNCLFEDSRASHIRANKANITIEGNRMYNSGVETLILQDETQFTIKNNHIETDAIVLQTWARTGGTITDNDLLYGKNGVMDINSNAEMRIRNNTMKTDGNDIFSIENQIGPFLAFDNICEPDDPDCNMSWYDEQDSENNIDLPEDQQNSSICSNLEGKYTRTVFDNYAQTHHGGSPCW